MLKNILYLSLCLAAVFPLNAKKKLRQVQARENSRVTTWKTYQARTIDELPGFYQAGEPEISRYGGWKTTRRDATGFFRTERIGDRWWIIDPDGYPFIHRGVAVFSPGTSERQQMALSEKFGNTRAWLVSQTEMLKSYGFNGTGAWSATDSMRQMSVPLVYTVIVNPMGRYKATHIERYGGKYPEAGWQGYRYDLVMVFDPEFDRYVEETIAPLEKYRNDTYLLGYFTDNELPWKADALDRHLTLLAKDEPGYLAAREWLDKRKGRNAAVSEITPEDRLAFTAYYFETYIKKVTTALRKADPNHLYLGCRFNQDKNLQELSNPEIFKVAGRYMDIISVNHYRKWQPEQAQFDNWAEWSGRPILVTEWYVKGEDSGLPNRSGAGWNVRTQEERGLFYENFTLELLKNKACVGWHWFRYQDNDPQNERTDSSNRDSNKGIVDSEYNPYLPLLEHASRINRNAYGLIRYFDGRVSAAPTTPGQIVDTTYNP